MGRKYMAVQHQHSQASVTHLAYHYTFFIPHTHTYAAGIKWLVVVSVGKQPSQSSGAPLCLQNFSAPT